MNQTDAQWASAKRLKRIEVNRKSRDKRRHRRATEPAFREREANEAASYRERRARGVPVRVPAPPKPRYETILCWVCFGTWQRKICGGAKPKACAGCLPIWRRMQARRYRAELRSPIQRPLCKACGQRWKRERPGGKRGNPPQRCPECKVMGRPIGVSSRQPTSRTGYVPRRRPPPKLCRTRPNLCSRCRSPGHNKLTCKDHP